MAETEKRRNGASALPRSGEVTVEGDSGNMDVRFSARYPDRTDILNLRIPIGDGSIEVRGNSYMDGYPVAAAEKQISKQNFVVLMIKLSDGGHLIRQLGASTDKKHLWIVDQTYHFVVFSRSSARSN